eukprot:scaffold32398_cov53-Attheya_sp.AAC.3
MSKAVVASISSTQLNSTQLNSTVTSTDAVTRDDESTTKHISEKDVTEGVVDDECDTNASDVEDEQEQQWTSVTSLSTMHCWPYNNVLASVLYALGHRAANAQTNTDGYPWLLGSPLTRQQRKKCNRPFTVNQNAGTQPDCQSRLHFFFFVLVKI